MKPETLAALNGSINKWKQIAYGTLGDEGSDNCPLCQLFVLKENTCANCPVAQNTGLHGCNGTPYMYYEGDDFKLATSESDIATAWHMYWYLMGLRPKNRGKELYK